MDKPVVVIIDSTLNRRRQMANAFKDLAIVNVAYRDDNGVICTSIYEGASIKKLEGVLLALTHVRDQKLLPELNVSLSVYYSGNGGTDTEIPTDAERIFRRINPGEGILSSEEASQLLAYATECQKAFQDVTKPNFLLCNSIEILSVLSILCQGYLAVHANHFQPEVETALQYMGWQEFLNSHQDASVISADLASNQGEVKKTGWWLQVFDNSNAHTLMDRVTIEWNERKYGSVCDCVKDLMKALTGEVIEDPIIVARAYLAIAKRLDQD